MKSFTLTHKIRLTPTHKQEKYFRQACGVTRFTWNWALAEWKKQYEAGKKPTALSLKRQFNAIKPIEFPWTYDVTKYASQQPFIFLQSAFRGFFRKKAKYPQFKRKGIRDSFYIGNDHIKIEGKRVHVPKLGWVKMRELLRFQGKIMSATISLAADKWFISLNVELNQSPQPCENQAVVGVDLGVNRLATLSNGEMIEGLKPLKKHLAKLKRLQRQLSSKQKGSSNRNKARMKVARLHYRISCIRQDTLHKLTSYLGSNFGAIAIEDLNVKGMMSNHCLARSIADMGFFEFRRQLGYKTEIGGSYIKIVDRWFPSSKRCCRCKTINDSITLSDRIFKCGRCGLKIDRELNAAINLKSTVSSTGFQACGEKGAGLDESLSETGLSEAGTKPCTDMYTA